MRSSNEMEQVDLIDRQAAIDVINAVFPVDPMKSEYAQGIACGAALAKTYIEQLPSAQPEPIKINIDDFNKEDLERFKKELGNTPITVLPTQPEVIRCKDCKHWIPYDWMFSEVWQSKNIADYPEDEIGCNYCDMAMKANDFCSRGERKNDG